jgi:Na+/pantothenate symporter
LDGYLEELEMSTLPLPLWGVALLWFVIFVAGHVMFRRARVVAQSQSILKTGDPITVAKSSTPKFIVLQLFFAIAIFTASHFIGGPAYAFLAGGWVVTTTASVAVNITSLLFVRALAKPEAATGSVTFSNPLVMRESAYYFFGLSVFCLIVGILTAHLSVLGGAFFIAATGLGYLRKAPRA